MKLKISKGFNIDKCLQKIEPHAMYFVWWFGIILALATVINVSNILNPTNQIIIWVCFFFFMFAGLIVSLSALRRSKRKGTEMPANIDHPSRNRWISIGLLILVVIVIGLIFVARQLSPTPQGYQTFFMAFAAIGAWGTGIAIAVFAYQQYKLRQTEHKLLFEPQILLRSAGTPKTGKLTYNNKIYPYGIEWTVLMLNTSQQPILIEFMSLGIRQLGWGKATDKDGYLSISSYHVLEPDGLEPPFQITQTTPQRIRLIIEGYNAGQDLDDIFGDSNNRNFALIFSVQVTNPQDPSTSIFYGIISNSFRIPKDAPWGDKITTLT